MTGGGSACALAFRTAAASAAIGGEEFRRSGGVCIASQASLDPLEGTAHELRRPRGRIPSQMRLDQTGD